MPTRSNAPIIDSTDAAGTADRPLSLHSEMKCVCTSPLVLSPQTKNVPARIRNVRLCATSNSTVNGRAKSIGAGATPPEPGTTGLSPASPSARSPTSLGWSRISKVAKTTTPAHATHTGISALRQP